MSHSDPGSRLISVFGNAFQQTPSGTTTIETFLHGVQSGQWKKQVEDVRALTDSEQIKEAKKRVPAVAPSALFNGKRGKAYVQQHSGFLNLDLDNKENPGIADRAARARVYADQYVFAGHACMCRLTRHSMKRHSCSLKPIFLRHGAFILTLHCIEILRRAPSLPERSVSKQIGSRCGVQLTGQRFRIQASILKRFLARYWQQVMT